LKICKRKLTIEAKSQEKDTQNLENQANKLVYDLYDLIEDEIEVVEKKVK
jgi:hypothetical protein